MTTQDCGDRTATWEGQADCINCPAGRFVSCLTRIAPYRKAMECIDLQHDNQGLEISHDD